MSLDAIILEMLFLVNLLLLLLTPQFGQAIEVELSVNAELQSTTVFYLLVPLMISGKSKTLGEIFGEKEDTSELLWETPAPFATIPHTPLYDFIPSLSRVFSIHKFF